jgi:hypothetical protein
MVTMAVSACAAIGVIATTATGNDDATNNERKNRLNTTTSSELDAMVDGGRE